MKLIDVSRTSKGTKSGGLQSFSAMVVVGDGQGLVGLGTGKAADLMASVRKATLRAQNRLQFIPRFNESTIPHPVATKFGKCKLRMWPQTSGAGITAHPTMMAVAKLAGIQDLGIKLYGSRNIRNAVKGFFKAALDLQPVEQQAQQRGRVAVEVLCGSQGGRNMARGVQREIEQHYRRGLKGQPVLQRDKQAKLALRAGL
jgi:small subunit ribosomal protein S5